MFLSIIRVPPRPLPPGVLDYELIVRLRPEEYTTFFDALVHARRDSLVPAHKVLLQQFIDLVCTAVRS